MKNFSITLILSFAFTLSVFAQEKPDTVSFVHISDTHFNNLAGYSKLIVNSRKHLNHAPTRMSAFFSRDLMQEFDFVIVSGDIVDFYDAETPSKGKFLATQIEQVGELLNTCNVTIYMALGNHDIGTYYGQNSLRSHQYKSAKARATWIRNFSCFKDGTYYSKKISVDSTNYRLIFLDNSYYTIGRIESPFIIDDYQLIWLKEELRKSKNDNVIIIMHMPLINPDEEEIAKLKKDYSNFSFTEPMEHEIVIPNKRSYELHRIVKNNPCVKLFLTGHLHCNTIDKVKFSEDYSLTHVITGGMLYSEHDWRKIQLTKDNIILYYSGTNKMQYSVDITK